MPPHQWVTPPLSIVNLIATRGFAEAGALLNWSAWAVESLHYLCDLDCDTFAAERGEHNDHIVDASHLRWATSTAITALDLCAGTLGRVFVGEPDDDHELSLRNLELGLNPSNGKLARRAKLSPPALAWVDRVSADPDYRRILEIRNPMTHSRVIRTVIMSQRRVEVQSAEHGNISTRDAIVMACDLATRHVEALLASSAF